MSAVLSIANAAETKVQLCLDNVLDGFVFEGSELGGGLVLFVARIKEVLRALERAKMFGAKGRAAVEVERHVGRTGLSGGWQRSA